MWLVMLKSVPTIEFTTDATKKKKNAVGPL